MSAAATALARKPASLHAKEREANAIALQRIDDRLKDRNLPDDRADVLAALESRSEVQGAQIAALEEHVLQLQQVIARLTSGSVVVGPEHDRVCARNACLENG